MTDQRCVHSPPAPAHQQHYHQHHLPDCATILAAQNRASHLRSACLWRWYSSPATAIFDDLSKLSIRTGLPLCVWPHRCWIVHPEFPLRLHQCLERRSALPLWFRQTIAPMPRHLLARVRQSFFQFRQIIGTAPSPAHAVTRVKTAPNQHRQASCQHDLDQGAQAQAQQIKALRQFQNQLRAPIGDVWRLPDHLCLLQIAIGRGFAPCLAVRESSHMWR